MQFSSTTGMPNSSKLIVIPIACEWIVDFILLIGLIVIIPIACSWIVKIFLRTIYVWTIIFIEFIENGTIPLAIKF